MNDQTPPTPPPPSEPPPGPDPGSAPLPDPEPAAAGPDTSTGLDAQLSGLLCYILGIVTGLIFFLIEKKSDVVRFHAAQAIVFSIAVFVLMIALNIFQFVLYQISWGLGGIFGLLSTLVWLATFVLWIVLLVKGYSGEKWKLPIVGDIAERLAASA